MITNKVLDITNVKEMCKMDSFTSYVRCGNERGVERQWGK